MLSASGNLGSTLDKFALPEIKWFELMVRLGGWATFVQREGVPHPSGFQGPDFDFLTGSALQNPGRWLRAWRHASESVHASRKIRHGRCRCQ